MVAAPVVLVLVARNAIMKSHLASQTTFGEQLQGAIDGGEADTGILLLHQSVQLLGGEVIARLEESTQDGVALLGVLETNFFKVAMEDVLSFADRLTRDRYLVVNAFLQHTWSQFL